MFKISIVLPAVLFFFSLVTILIALVQAFQIPLGALPDENLRLASVPFSYFAHVFGGALFGLIGPLQFGRVLANKFGRLHRVLGRIFVISGAALSLSSLSILWQFPGGASPFVSGGRLVFGIALGFALIISMLAIRKRNIKRHRNWIIRAYALGIGATAVSMVFIPIYAVTGEPPVGLFSDIVFIGSWALCVVIAEFVIHRLK